MSEKKHNHQSDDKENRDKKANQGKGEAHNYSKNFPVRDRSPEARTSASQEGPAPESSQEPKKKKGWDLLSEGSRIQKKAASDPHRVEDSSKEVLPAFEAAPAPEPQEPKQEPELKKEQGDTFKPGKLSKAERNERNKLGLSPEDYSQLLEARKSQQSNQPWNKGTSEERIAALKEKLSENGQAYLQEELERSQTKQWSSEQTIAVLTSRAEGQGKTLPEFLEIIGKDKAKETPQILEERNRRENWHDNTIELLSKPAREGNLMTLSPEDRKQALQNHPERRFEMPLLIPDSDQPGKYIFNPERREIQEHIEKARNALQNKPQKWEVTYNQAIKDIKAEVAVELALHNQETIGKFPPSGGYQVLTNVVFDREYASEQEFRDEHPGSPKHIRGLHTRVDEKTLEERSFFRVGESDILMRNTHTNEVVFLGEVKSGGNDQPSVTRKQLDNAQRLFSNFDENDHPFDGHHPIRAFIDSKEYNDPRFQDITDKIKASSVAQAETQSYGPALKGFDQSIGVTSEELDLLVDELVNLPEK